MEEHGSKKDRWQRAAVIVATSLALILLAGASSRLDGVRARGGGPIVLEGDEASPFAGEVGSMPRNAPAPADPRGREADDGEGKAYDAIKNDDFNSWFRVSPLPSLDHANHAHAAGSRLRSDRFPCSRGPC